MSSVTATDIFQFIILIAVLPYIMGLAVNEAGGIQEILNKVPSEKFKIFSHDKFWEYLVMFIMCSIIPVGNMDPALGTRLLMAKTEDQIKNQFFVIVSFQPIFEIAIMLIGLAAIVLYPDVPPLNAIPHIINNLLPIGIKGVAISAIIAIILSSADSWLHASGLTFARDIVRPIGDKMNIEINELKWARYSTPVICLVTAVCALFSNSIISELWSISIMITEPIFMVPFTIGVMGLKSSKKAFYTAMCVTLVTLVVAKILYGSEQGYLVTLTGIIVNAIVFLTTNIIDNGGIVIVNRKDGTERVWGATASITKYFSRWREFIPTPSNIIQYSQNSVEKYGAPYVLFGVVMAIYYIFPVYMWQCKYQNMFIMVLNMRMLGGIIAGILITHFLWSDKFARFFTYLLACFYYISTSIYEHIYVPTHKWKL